MSRCLARVPLFSGSFLLTLQLLLPACDPEYSLCVVATSCMSDLPIAGAHVRIQAYELDGSADSAGKICKEALSFPAPFQIEVDAPGYIAKTGGPFQLANSGTTGFQATVCLDPQP